MARRSVLAVAGRQPRSWEVHTHGRTLVLEVVGWGAGRAGGLRGDLEHLLWEAVREPGAAHALSQVGAALGLPSRQPRTMHDALRRALRAGALRLRERGHPTVVPTPLAFAPEPPAAAPPTGDPSPPSHAVPRRFEVRVVDEVGVAIEGVAVSFDHLGQAHPATTDGAGLAALDAEGVSFATVRVSDTKALATTLAPRWQTPRPPQIPPDEPEAPVVVEHLDDNFDPLPLEHGVTTTLVIAPRFHCREVPATSFDFGRSFVKRDGIERLAQIARELQQEDGQKGLIHGHTDLSGGDALNKRLSERRARAVFALLTHDVALWEGMWTGAGQGDAPHWFEVWGTREMQHMLNSLSCFDDEGLELGEDGQYGSRTRQSVKRFQRGDYPARPAEQPALPETGSSDRATREQLFFAYAKLAGREPVDVERLVEVGGARFVGCGEFNPLSLSAKDRESRRVVVFVFDPAAQPSAPPCRLGDHQVCRGQLVDEVPTESPFYRCAHYRSIATCCHPVGGPDLAHDVIVRFEMPLSEANALPEAFVLESEDEPDEDGDPGFSQRQTLASDAKSTVPPNEADDDPPNADVDEQNVDETAAVECELHFSHVPDAHTYRLRVEGVEPGYTVFTRTPFHEISELSAPDQEALFPRIQDRIVNNPFGI